MKQHYIYITTNLINGKQYIGQHFGEIDDAYIGSGSALKRAIEKYGKENFTKEILEICTDYDSMNFAERKWIEKFDAVNNEKFYNIADGGFNSNPCAGMSKAAQEARKKKLSEAVKGEKNYFYGKHFYNEDHPMYGKNHSEESKEKMRQAKLGGKAPTARAIQIFDKDWNFIAEFETQKALKIFLGLCPISSTSPINNAVKLQKLYHGYYLKYKKN